MGPSLLHAGVLMLLFFCALLTARARTPSPSAQERAGLAIRAMQSWYDAQTGLYRTTGWWNSANAITTLADYALVSGSHEFDPVFANTFTAAQKTSVGFLNNFYDDEGWWALAWVDAYDLTGDKRYLGMAQSIFADMSGGWDETCAGGIWWSKDRKYKNAIANELFLSVAAHLATRVSKGERKQYLVWAKREWKWFLQTGMINGEHLINDGLDASCKNNQKTTWTYNQGVVLGGLAELSRVDHDRTLLPVAKEIAAGVFASATLVDSKGILHDPCEPAKCGDDAPQFKGIFVRNLRELQKVSPVPGYERFITANADSIWSGATAPDYHLGLVWSAPFGDANASTHSSATDALVAALSLR